MILHEESPRQRPLNAQFEFMDTWLQFSSYVHGHDSCLFHWASLLDPPKALPFSDKVIYAVIFHATFSHTVHDWPKQICAMIIIPQKEPSDRIFLPIVIKGTDPVLFIFC